MLFSGTVDHPTNMVEAPKLPACENLTESVTAENLFFNGTPVSVDFMTIELARFIFSRVGHVHTFIFTQYLQFI